MSSTRNPVSVFELKRGFLASQTQVLSQTLTIKDDIQSYTTAEDETIELEIPKSTLIQVISKVNAAIRKHHQLVFSSVAIRHVAEQLDALYTHMPSDPEILTANLENIFAASMDIGSSNNLQALPEFWPIDAEDETLSEETRRYRELVANINTLRSAIDSLREKHSYYALILKSTSPFADPMENVQSNLVTRNGELAQELNRTRILAARLSETLGSLTRQ